jgi:UDP-N-acetylmuramoyl-tripeptide--D-alanyl-D-alanine ligase
MRQAFKTLIVFILQWEAKAVLRKYNPRVVAITGSVGKTSTKDAVYAVLSKKFPCKKSEKSFNSELGVPLTILGLQNAWSNPIHWLQNIVDGLSLIVTTHNYPEWLVLEVGADRPGDIRSWPAG